MEDREPEVFGAIAPKWESLAPVLTAMSPFAGPAFDEMNLSPDNNEPMNNVAAARVLVVGAGGLGCEILKDLALSGFTNIDVIDMDTIDISNLNRQFLFRETDVGRPKAEVAARFVMNRVKGVNVTAHCKRIQEFPREWYSQFSVVISGLDNIPARQWLNETLVDLVTFDEMGALSGGQVPLIDGGVEGFAGQARVFWPRTAACFECAVKTLTPQTGFQMCTIAHVPRLPEHCVAYAKTALWPALSEFTDSDNFKLEEQYISALKNPNPLELDTDNPEHMTWLYKQALARAEQYKIEGVTYSKTMQVVKNIIPAIAATNALISAACANEAFKICSRASKSLVNWFKLFGSEKSGVVADTVNFKQDPDCRVCRPVQTLRLTNNSTLAQLLLALTELLPNRPPSFLLTSLLAGKTLYNPSPIARGDFDLGVFISSLFSSGTVLLAGIDAQISYKVLVLFE